MSFVLGISTFAGYTQKSHSFVFPFTETFSVSLLGVLIPLSCCEIGLISLFFPYLIVALYLAIISLCISLSTILYTISAFLISPSEALYTSIGMLSVSVFWKTNLGNFASGTISPQNSFHCLLSTYPFSFQNTLRGPTKAVPLP